MKKIFPLLFLILILSCCTPNKEKDYNFCDKIALSYSIDFLNEKAGYNTVNRYDILRFSLKNGEDYPIYYQLVENDDIIISFIIQDADKDQIIGERNYINDGKTIALTPLFENNVIDKYNFKEKGIKRNINNFLYLDNIKAIKITNDYSLTSADKITIIKEAIIDNESLFGLNKGDKVTVYEHLNVINLKYDDNTKAITQIDNDFLYYPFAINKKAEGVVCFKKDNFERVMAFYLQENVAEAIDNQKSFVLVTTEKTTFAFGLMITADSILDFKAPMIVVKSFKPLKAIATNQENYAEFFCFIY